MLNVHAGGGLAMMKAAKLKRLQRERAAKKVENHPAIDRGDYFDVYWTTTTWAMVGQQSAGWLSRLLRLAEL